MTKPNPNFWGPNCLSGWYLYDFDVCQDRAALSNLLEEINRHGYDLVTVTQDATGVYTVFFRRRACG